MAGEGPPGESPNVAAAAASSAITAYRPNGTGSPVPRTLDALLAWAAGHGVTVPDWAEVRVAVEGYEPEVNGRAVPAVYFQVSVGAPTARISRRGREPSVVDPRSGRVVVKVRRSALDSDEQFLHVLAHETFELRALKEVFDETPGGRLTAAALHDLTRAERGLNNLHSEAWDHADEVLRLFRAASEPDRSER